LIGEAVVLKRIADHLSCIRRGVVLAILVLQAVALEIDTVVDVVVAAVVLDHGPHRVGALRARSDRLRTLVALKTGFEPVAVDFGLAVDVGAFVF
jgi:hypothetical protein